MVQKDMDELGGMGKALVETFPEVIEETINTMTFDIMEVKSVSLGEGCMIATRFFLMGIKPKSKEFYNEVEIIKTLWER